jgi:hypothetical protein
MAGRLTGYIPAGPPAVHPTSGARATVAGFAPAVPLPTGARAGASGPLVARLQINSETREGFQNLYGLLIAMDVLEHEYARGGVPQADFERSLGDLKSQLSRLSRACDWSTSDIFAFCGRAGIKTDFLRGSIEEGLGGSPGGGDQKRTVSVAMSLGSAFTTLSDLCHMNEAGQIESHQFSQYITEIRSGLNILGFYQSRPEVKARTDKWMDRFGAFRPNDRVPVDVSQQLASEIAMWRSEATPA